MFKKLTDTQAFNLVMMCAFFLLGTILCIGFIYFKQVLGLSDFVFTLLNVGVVALMISAVFVVLTIRSFKRGL